jgi:hypothetical protein
MAGNRAKQGHVRISGPVLVYLGSLWRESAPNKDRRGENKRVLFRQDRKVPCSAWWGFVVPQSCLSWAAMAGKCAKRELNPILTK